MMGMIVDWRLILMTLGAAFGSLLMVIFYAVTSSDLSLTFFPLFTFGGFCLGWLIEKAVSRVKK